VPGRHHVAWPAGALPGIPAAVLPVLGRPRPPPRWRSTQLWGKHGGRLAFDLGALQHHAPPRATARTPPPVPAAKTRRPHRIIRTPTRVSRLSGTSSNGTVDPVRRWTAITRLRIVTIRYGRNSVAGPHPVRSARNTSVNASAITSSRSTSEPVSEPAPRRAAPRCRSYNTPYAALSPARTAAVNTASLGLSDSSSTASGGPFNDTSPATVLCHQHHSQHHTRGRPASPGTRQRERHRARSRTGQGTRVLQRNTSYHATGTAGSFLTVTSIRQWASLAAGPQRKKEFQRRSRWTPNRDSTVRSIDIRNMRDLERLDTPYRHTSRRKHCRRPPELCHE
jgi:hypothetical protein